MSDSTQTKARSLISYSIASGDMYYSELEMRDVFAMQDPDKGFRIWGELHGGGPKSAVNLCQIMLEYGMYLRSWCTEAEAEFHMADFGSHLGIRLANVLKESGAMTTEDCPGACALMCLLESMDVQLSVEQVGPELHFMSASCPIDETALKTGMREVELAYIGVNALAHSLIHSFDPQLIVELPAKAPVDHHFEVDLKIVV